MHRILMRFSYAMTFGAVTLRLQIPFGMMFFGFHSYTEMSPWLAYTSLDSERDRRRALHAGSNAPRRRIGPRRARPTGGSN